MLYLGVSYPPKIKILCTPKSIGALTMSVNTYLFRHEDYILHYAFAISRGGNTCNSCFPQSSYQECTRVVGWRRTRASSPTKIVHLQKMMPINGDTPCTCWPKILCRSHESCFWSQVNRQYCTIQTERQQHQSVCQRVCWAEGVASHSFRIYPFTFTTDIQT